VPALAVVDPKSYQRGGVRGGIDSFGRAQREHRRLADAFVAFPGGFGTLEEIRRQAEESRSRAESLRGELEESVRRLDRLRAEVADAERELREVREQTASTRQHLQAVRRLREVNDEVGEVRHSVGEPGQAAPTPAAADQADGRTETVVISASEVGAEPVPPAEGKKQLGVTVDVDAASGTEVVVGVGPDTPAEKAGLQPGDVITGVNGHPAGAGEGLTEAVAHALPGEDVVLQVARGPEVTEVKAHVEESHDAPGGGPTS